MSEPDSEPTVRVAVDPSRHPGYTSALWFIHENGAHWLLMREQGWTLERLSAHFTEFLPAQA